MPVYEYECVQCQKVHEVQQKITDPPLATCPECGGEVKKLISMSSFHLKGGGWYADGYSKSNGNGKNGSGADTKSDKKESKSSPPCGKSESCQCCQASASS